MSNELPSFFKPFSVRSLVRNNSSGSDGSPNISSSKKSAETQPGSCELAYLANLMSISSKAVSHASVILCMTSSMYLGIRMHSVLRQKMIFVSYSLTPLCSISIHVLQQHLTEAVSMLKKFHSRKCTFSSCWPVSQIRTFV